MFRIERSVSLAGLSVDPPAGVGTDLRSLLVWIAAKGARAVTLDATAADVRPRDLDTSARREVAALVKRHGLSLAGVDVWVPESHFASAATVHRAADAVAAAIVMAGQVGTRLGAGRVVVSVGLGRAPVEVVSALLRTAEREGVELVDGSWSAREEGGARVSVDPAAVLAAGGDAASVVVELSKVGRLGSARLSDFDGVERVVVGRGKLDVVGYEAACGVAGVSRLVVDLRGRFSKEDGVEAGVG